MFTSTSIVWFLSGLALAEGTDEWTSIQDLDGETELYVDILDHTVETVTWTNAGANAVDVYDPSGNFHVQIETGDTFVPDENGPWLLDIDQDHGVGTWDVTVNNPADDGGRVHSYAWRLNSGSFSEVDAFDGSVYIVVDGGNGNTPVVEMDFNGFAGFSYSIRGNRSGVAGLHGRSLDGQDSADELIEFPIYLNPPSNATYSTESPSVSNLAFVGTDAAGDVPAAPLDETCNTVLEWDLGYLHF